MHSITKLFGFSKEQEPALTPQKAIQKLQNIETMLIKKSEHLESKITGELKIAKEQKCSNKRAALQALKRKKRYEKQLHQIDGTLSTIELQREALENAATNTEVLKVMGESASAIKAAHNNMDIDKVHDLMDDVAEQQEIANEISEAISNPVGFGQDIDEDELLQELEDLEQEELERELLNVGTPVTDQLPSVPTGEPELASASSQKAKEEEDELSVLTMWAE
ncbi:charged multivesicular body protein 4c isoform X1 [Octopus bimaculoides]|uniref:Charged multivesicular body protein 4b n=1 Tax=Octopus bimaculoides TaxID=37653 RepID=A0A0L8GX98_OCTBM|nr:charged multivesicular body protein 4c isoform X1 [Octopus bimaculoides]|eukprot:XP_014777572.1 PREDICTED: charged multivesicular body protein 4c-like [Octopus bimaculoides]